MSELSTTCAPFEQDLSALLDGELAPEREAEVRAHLHACADCRDRLESLCSVDLALAGTALPEVPDGMRERIEARLEGDDSRPVATVVRARRRLRPTVGSAMALAASLAIYLAVGPGSEPSDPLLEQASPEELAVILELETIEDLDVIANLDVLERIADLDAGRGSS